MSDYEVVCGRDTGLAILGRGTIGRAAHNGPALGLGPSNLGLGLSNLGLGLSNLGLGPNNLGLGPSNLGI